MQVCDVGVDQVRCMGKLLGVSTHEMGCHRILIRPLLESFKERIY